MDNLDLDLEPVEPISKIPDGVEMTTSSIGRELGISQQAAAIILRRAIRKAREALERRGMSLDDLMP